MTRAVCLAFGLLLAAQAASAHRIDQYLQATVLALSVDHVHASMRLIPGAQMASEVIGEIDRDGDDSFSDDEQRAYVAHVLDALALTLDAQTLTPKVLSFSFPPPNQMRDGIGEIHIEYVANLSKAATDRRLRLVNHYRERDSVYLMNILVPDNRDIQILAQRRNQQQSSYEIEYRQAFVSARVADSAHAGASGWSNLQFANLFALGLHHIAEGSDHLLFLLTLLLPAPLLMARGRWGHPASLRHSVFGIARIVTAFTLGHSMTLGLAAFGGVDLPTRTIEVLIAVSILVAALHAWRPLVSGKEAWIAGAFGLVHGLAFATTLERLGLRGLQRVAGVLAFNLGIETMQLAVVAAVLPSLLILSRTRSYGPFRLGGACIAGVAAVALILERSFDVATPFEPVATALARHAPALASSFFLGSIVCYLRPVLASSAPANRPV